MVRSFGLDAVEEGFQDLAPGRRLVVVEVVTRIGDFRVLAGREDAHHFLGLGPAQFAVEAADHQGRAADLGELLPVGVVDPGLAGRQHLAAGEDRAPAVRGLVHDLGEEGTAAGVGTFHPGVVLAEPAAGRVLGGEGEGPVVEPVLPFLLGGRAQGGGAHVADDHGFDQVRAAGRELPGGEGAHGVADQCHGGEAELLDGRFRVGHEGLTAQGGGGAVGGGGRAGALAVSALVQGHDAAALAEPAGGAGPVEGAAHQPVQ